MGKGSKSGACRSASHQLFKDRAKNRVDDLQGMFSNLQSARKESRNIDVAVLEEQLHQLLREWKAELNEPSPASSLQGGSLGSFSTDICRLLQLCDEEDDATSALAAPKPEPDGQKVPVADFNQGFAVPHVHHEQSLHLVDDCKSALSGVNNVGTNHMSLLTQLDYQSFNLPHEFDQHYFPGFDVPGFIGEDGVPQIPDFTLNICPPPSAFLGPKCALWDCPRPAQAWCQKSQDYCSDYHATLAPSEGYHGIPVLRPGGIGLKDSLLFAALSAKAHGKDVGIPECEGAATAKSPWNARDLFDLDVLEGETIREWLFFDKPRRAFETGSRKQRSLPDYNGRGWHESRKQVMNEYGGLKRSYYMDPQPKDLMPNLPNFEWHLYEYEITKYDVCALYRLELKRVDAKNSPKGKVTNDSVAALQKQMGRLTAEFQAADNKRSGKGRAKANPKDASANVNSTSNRMVPPSGDYDFGASSLDNYLVDDINGYYLT